MSQSVSPQETYSLLVNTIGRRERAIFRIERIADGKAHCKLLPSERPYAVSVLSLARRARGARLVVDGVEQVRPDSRRVVHRRARLAATMLASGKSVQDIAEHFGVARGTVQSWLQAVRKESES